MTDFVTTVVASLDIGSRQSGTQGSRIGLLTYGNDPTFEFNLNEFLDSDTELLNAINVKFTHGTTNTADAIRWGYITPCDLSITSMFINKTDRNLNKCHVISFGSCSTVGNL